MCGRGGGWWKVHWWETAAMRSRQACAMYPLCAARARNAVAQLTHTLLLPSWSTVAPRRSGGGGGESWRRSRRSAEFSGRWAATAPRPGRAPTMSALHGARRHAIARSIERIAEARQCPGDCRFFNLRKRDLMDPSSREDSPRVGFVQHRSARYESPERALVTAAKAFSNHISRGRRSKREAPKISQSRIK